MRIENYSITVKTNGFCHVLDLSSDIQAKVTESGLWNGQVLVFDLPDESTPTLSGRSIDLVLSPRACVIMPTT